MGFWDWLIVIIPMAFIIGIGMYSMKYVRGVVDFLSAGRVARRYVISTGSVAMSMSIIGLVAYIEVQYKTGFALAFWSNLMLPVSVVMALTGFCIYRFRETKSMSLGQFLEMRYNRPVRIFASSLRSLSEILANMIMPAVAGRFFIYFLDLPRSIVIGPWEISTFFIIMFICLTLAISLICFSGTLSLLITDALQGIFLFPLMAIFVVFVLYKFDWATEIAPVMIDRAADESFINPYDIEKLRDFNIFMVLLSLVTGVVHAASWIGAGYSTAAITPHEQKMARLVGTWRDALNIIFYLLIALCIVTMMNHANFATSARNVRVNLSRQIALELVNEEHRSDFIHRIETVPEQRHQIGKDEPLSQEKNLDTPILEVAHQALKEYNGEEKGNAKFQEYRTIFHQQMLAVGLRELLPPLMMGAFCLLMVMAMVSTDDSRIFSSAITITQDVIVPFCSKQLSPKIHILILRLVSIGVGILFLFGSTYMSQLDYINLFVTLMSTMWLGGCAPVMIFGLYSRFGNAWGAFSSLMCGIASGGFGIFIQRNWADIVYPWLVRHGWVDSVGNFLETVSSPLNPYVVWKIDAVKCPINSYEYYFLTMLVSLLLFIGVSALTQKKPFNLERMLHRGIYNTDHENKEREKWSWRSVWSKLLGITPVYTLNDRIIAWGVFGYSFIFQFVLLFLVVVIWNAISPWPMSWWSNYFYITSLVIPGIIAFISTFWFGIGGTMDICRLFKDLEKRHANHLDNGMVEGNVSISDTDAFEKAENKEKSDE